MLSDRRKLTEYNDIRHSLEAVLAYKQIVQSKEKLEQHMDVLKQQEAEVSKCRIVLLQLIDHSVCLRLSRHTLIRQLLHHSVEANRVMKIWGHQVDLVPGLAAWASARPVQKHHSSTSCTRKPTKKATILSG